MAIAATTVGINTMVANTRAQGGCAFACHQTNPSADNLGNPGGIDNYQLAKNLGVTTRIRQFAHRDPIADGYCDRQPRLPLTIRIAWASTHSIDNGVTTISALTSNLSTAKTLAGNIDVMVVYKNNWLTSTNNNSDMDTDFEKAMSAINTIMPAPGTGYTGSSPQEVLLLVSDGVDDKNTGATHTGQVGTYSGSRFMGLFDTSWCTTVKTRGIRIAVLYTEYLPLPTNAWYNTYVAPFQSKISANMKSCASPGLFFQVTTDQDISAAMAALFKASASAARLIK